MVLKSDQERVMCLLKDTITLLCKNGLNFKSKFCVDAVIGVTVDEDELFYISVKEVVKSEKALTEENKSDQSSGEESAGGTVHKNKDHKRRRRKRHIKSEGNASGAENKESEDDERGSPFPEHSEEEESNHQSAADQAAKRMRIKKENEEEEEDSDQDIVFIKQELDDNSWSQSQDMSGTGAGTSFQNFSGVSGMSGMHGSQQDQNFPSLADMNLTPLGVGEGSSGMWSSPQQQRRPYVPRGPRTPSSMTPNSQQQQQQQQHQGGDMMQQQEGMDSQQQGHQQYAYLHHGEKSLIKSSFENHRGEYQCMYCERGFRSTSALKGHLSVHTGVKDHKCGMCGKEFAYKEAYKRHLINVHKQFFPKLRRHYSSNDASIMK